jgi:glycosyltransferase involved in cell wall biosynthesis
MKILHITKYYNELGGIETLSRNITALLKKRYKNLTVISFLRKGNRKINNKKKIIYFKEDFNIFSTPFSMGMFNYFKKNLIKFDIIHVHFPNPWVAILLLIFLKKNNKLIINWDSDIINQNFLKYFFRPIQNYLLCRASKVICLSNNYFKHSKDLRKFKSKVKIIPPFLKKRKILRFKTKKKIKDKYRILSIGRLVKYKGFDVLIRAANLLNDNCEIMIIGDGPEKRKLINLIIKLRINSKVKIFSNIKDRQKYRIIDSSDLIVLASINRAESFGISMLEGIEAGKPGIVSDTKGSGMSDLIINGYNGYNFHNKSHNDLAKKIIKLISDKNKMKLFSNNSKTLYKKYFGSDLIKKSFLEIYENI